MAIDLPETPPNASLLNPREHQAYNICVQYQNVANTLHPDLVPFPHVVAARLLGYMIIHAPTAQGRSNISTEILSCTNNDDLFKLARLYHNHFLQCFRRAKGPTPEPSHHPSRPSFDNIQEMLGYLLENSPKSHATAKLQALERDGYRCPVSGMVDPLGLEANQGPPNAPVVATNASHIFPISTNDGINQDDKYEYAAGVWAVMERFGQVLITEELNGDDVNRLENILTLGVHIHDMFDKLSIWFESTGTVPDQYHVRAIHPRYLINLNTVITFTSTNDAYPLPSPRYIALHAACAKVAHLSGAGECIERVLRDIETTQVMSNDGRSARLLEAALGRIAVC